MLVVIVLNHITKLSFTWTWSPCEFTIEQLPLRRRPLPCMGHKDFIYLIYYYLHNANRQHRIVYIFKTNHVLHILLWILYTKFAHLATKSIIKKILGATAHWRPVPANRLLASSRSLVRRDSGERSSTQFRYFLWSGRRISQPLLTF